MKLIRIRCTNCGAEFDNVEEGQLYFHCSRKGCGAVFMTDLGEKFAAIEKSKADQIQKLRQGLKENLAPFHKEQVQIYAKEILSMIPGDFRAETSLCLCELADGNCRPLRQLLEGPIQGTEEEFIEMFPFILERCDYRELVSLKKASDQYLSEDSLTSCQAAIKVRESDILREDQEYADVPRDIFICYSSMDEKIADAVVKALENDGYTCWISDKNLSPDSPNYWAEIENAVRRCTVFLTLTSKASMLSKDVIHELSYAEQNGNLRLELKLDDEPHTTQFKYFFDGISWVNASNGLDGALSVLKTRVFDLLHQNGDDIIQESKTRSYTGNSWDSELDTTLDKERNENDSQFNFIRVKKDFILIAFLIALILLLFLQNSDNFWGSFSKELTIGSFNTLFLGALAVRIYSMIAVGDICILFRSSQYVVGVFTALPGVFLFLYIFIYNIFFSETTSVPVPAVYTPFYMRIITLMVLLVMAISLLTALLSFSFKGKKDTTIEEGTS